MNITQIRFSHASVSKQPHKNVAFFSVQFDNKLIVHRFRVVTGGTNKVLRVLLPDTLVGSKNNQQTKPIVWIEDQDLLSELFDFSLTMYKQLLKEYDGYYDYKTYGDHDTITVQRLKEQRAKDMI